MRQHAHRGPGGRSSMGRVVEVIPRSLSTRPLTERPCQSLWLDAGLAVDEAEEVFLRPSSRARFQGVSRATHGAAHRRCAPPWTIGRPRPVFNAVREVYTVFLYRLALLRQVHPKVLLRPSLTCLTPSSKMSCTESRFER